MEGEGTHYKEPASAASAHAPPHAKSISSLTMYFLPVLR